MSATGPVSLNLQIFWCTVWWRGAWDAGNIYANFCLTSSVHSPPQRNVCFTINTWASSDNTNFTVFVCVQTAHCLWHNWLMKSSGQNHTVMWDICGCEIGTFESLHTSYICFCRCTVTFESVCVCISHKINLIPQMLLKFILPITSSDKVWLEYRSGQWLPWLMFSMEFLSLSKQRPW